MTPSGPEALCLGEGVQTAHLGLVQQLSHRRRQEWELTAWVEVLAHPGTVGCPSHS